ncbi:MAG: hypothetical protein HYV14_04475 [Elusimicrobia bacterium]|nr:hypothetical protein [Elusimicrobiota bacterium]
MKALVRLPSVDEEALLGAAYVMTEDAYVLVSRKGKGGAVELWPKKKAKPAALAAAFRREYANQVLRWSLTRDGLGLRAETLRRALLLAEAAGGRAEAPPASLTPEQKAEIAALLAEADADTGPRDPLGITVPWEESRKDR